VSDLRAVVRKFAARLRREFVSEIERDPRRFKQRVVGLLKAALPPGPGRPCDEMVGHAIKMHAAGKSWPEVYAACIPSIDSLDSDSRQLAQSRLRAAMRARKSRRKRVKSPPEFVTPTNP